MPSTLRPVGAAVALALLAACSSGGSSSPAPTQPTPQPSAPQPVAAQPAAPAAEPDEDPTTADGIFTVGQADRGAELYDDVCSECHETADWTESAFRSRWEDQSVFQLWYYINDRMPYDDPFSLSRQQVTDVLTYILQLNGLPTGGQELATDDDSIDDYWIRWATSR